ncbi:MAG: NepR family anti-sigma factor [Pseudomonadota bacterium]
MKPDSRKTDVDELIDANLKRAFEDLASEPVPDRFTELLGKLRSGEGTPGGGSSTDGGPSHEQ